eukprot:5401367-Heterocapsa_arctica.AAC.1
MVFIPKGEKIGDPEGVFRAPNETRPLSLSNAVAKLIAAALNATLSIICADSVHEVQQGFVRGRSIIDNVIALEAYAT